jgi:hypothetical protein
VELMRMPFKTFQQEYSSSDIAQHTNTICGFAYHRHLDSALDISGSSQENTVGENFSGTDNYISPAFNAIDPATIRSGKTTAGERGKVSTW